MDSPKPILETPKMLHGVKPRVSLRTECDLTLSNGKTFRAKISNSNFQAAGELVFTTAMVGYTEALTDPSFYGQILVFSYPLIGNYGVPKNHENLSIGFESPRIQVKGVVLSEECFETFHWNHPYTLGHWLMKSQIPIFTGIDTRQLVHEIRNEPHLLAKANTDTFYDPGAHFILDQVSTKKPLTFGKGQKRIAVLDCGVKWSILRKLQELPCEVTLYPWDTDPDSIDSDAWVISNGPGDPKNTRGLISNVKKLLDGSRPILGICLGHQLLALAAGANTVRMPYGHRGITQPIHEVGTKTGYITSQNHGYEVEAKSLPTDWRVWFQNANDESVEGIQHRSKPFWGIQFHPEASPGPQDAGILFNRFWELL